MYFEKIMRRELFLFDIELWKKLKKDFAFDYYDKKLDTLFYYLFSMSSIDIDVGFVP
jgi:hypothetical protein